MVKALIFCSNYFFTNFLLDEYNLIGKSNHPKEICNVIDYAREEEHACSLTHIDMAKGL